jgi:transcriptional regulator with XRE-family HTH domain
VTLRELRLRRGWSQEQLADASGVSVRTIQRIEGGRPPGRATAAALAGALEVDPALLVDPATEPVHPAGPAPDVPFTEALRRGVSGWGDFEGRASRSEFWFVLLAVLVVAGAPAALDERLGAAVLTLCLVPLLAVGTRRLRDAGQSPWWQLFYLAPMGFVVVFTLMAMRGRAEEPVPAGPSRP